MGGNDIVGASNARKTLHFLIYLLSKSNRFNKKGTDRDVPRLECTFLQLNQLEQLDWISLLFSWPYLLNRGQVYLREIILYRLVLEIKGYIKNE